MLNTCSRHLGGFASLAMRLVDFGRFDHMADTTDVVMPYIEFPSCERQSNGVRGEGHFQCMNTAPQG